MILIQQIGMPNVKKGATLQHIYDWLYNSGSYGRTPTIGDMLDMGWAELLAMGLVFYDTSNKDVRYRWDASGRTPTMDGWSTYNKHAARINCARNMGTVQEVDLCMVSGEATATQINKLQKRIAIITITIAAGISADNVIKAATGASYYPCARIIGMISDFTDNANTITFQDEDNAAVNGGAIAFSVNLTASTFNTQLAGVVLKSNNNKDLEVDVADAAGGGAGTLILFAEVWEEHA